MHPDEYRENVRQGLQAAFVPAYVAEFDIAAKLGVPAKDLPDQPLALVHAASVVLEAEGIANSKRGKA